MNKFKSLVVGTLFLFALAASACASSSGGHDRVGNGGPSDLEVRKELFPSGQLRARYFVRLLINGDEQRNGRYQEFHEERTEGQPAAGERFAWGRYNGAVKIDGFYIDGKRWGHWIEYDEHGKVVRVETYEEDEVIAAK